MIDLLAQAASAVPNDPLLPDAMEHGIELMLSASIQRVLVGVVLVELVAIMLVCGSFMWLLRRALRGQEQLRIAHTDDLKQAIAQRCAVSAPLKDGLTEIRSDLAEIRSDLTETNHQIINILQAAYEANIRKRDDATTPR